MAARDIYEDWYEDDDAYTESLTAALPPERPRACLYDLMMEEGPLSSRVPALAPPKLPTNVELAPRRRRLKSGTRRRSDKGSVAAWAGAAVVASAWLFMIDVTVGVGALGAIIVSAGGMLGGGAV